MRAIDWTKNVARGAFVVAALLVASPNALADGTPGAHAVHRAAAEHDLRVPLDQAVAVRLGAPAEGIAIGNPSIAGVSVQNDRTLFITGRSYGMTNLTVVGEDGRMVYSARVIVVADETGAVMVTRGNETTRMECTPICRPRPDIGDGREAFQTTNSQITGHASTANNH